MTKQTVRARLERIGIIPSIRLSSAADARFAAETVYAAGIPVVEITMTVPGALDVVADLAKTVPDLIVGAGTVMDAEGARRSVDAGARFITSPGFDRDVVEFALKERVEVLPGVLTPSEIMAALRAGADLLKVFPCAQFGGPSYIRVLKAPFPEVHFMAAGGVTQQTAAEFIRAGAVVIGVGVELVPRHAVRQRDAHWITELAHRFRSLVQEDRGEGAPRHGAADQR